MNVINLTIIIIFSLFLNPFKTSIEKKETSHLFLTIEEVWRPGPSQFTKTNSSPNFILIDEDEFQASINSRYDMISMYGKIKNLKSEKTNDTTLISFYVIGKKSYAGIIRSVEITLTHNNEVKVHFFDKLGKYDRYMNGHKATENEVAETIKFLSH